ncbi:MAG: hypothetical protein GYA62_02290, partial [Bacteroidales bacterium]|nr:hypothetical protein [Bacteroidales bacterium]
MIKDGLTGLHSAENEQYLLEQTLKDVFFVCYKNDSAVFWSNGDFLPLTFSKKTAEKTKIVFINDTWSYIHAKKAGDWFLVAF